MKKQEKNACPIRKILIILHEYGDRMVILLLHLLLTMGFFNELVIATVCRIMEKEQWAEINRHEIEGDCLTRAQRWQSRCAKRDSI